MTPPDAEVQKVKLSKEDPINSKSNNSNNSMDDTTKNTTNNKDDNKKKARDEKATLWKDSFEISTQDGATIQVMGMEEHVVYARCKTGKATIAQVVQAVVDENQKRTAKEILEQHVHVRVGEVPNADTLWDLGAIWLVNETDYISKHDAHARRLHKKNDTMTHVPNWEDETVRVHTQPTTYFNADEFEWTKYAKNLLIEKTVSVKIHDETPHIPTTGLPNEKDGVKVYENSDLGFMVISKPECVPVHATTSNHTQDVISKLKLAHPGRHISVPQSLAWNLETDMSGLLAVSTKHEFNTYLKNQYDSHKVTKTFKVLVAIKDETLLDKLEQFAAQETVLTHYVDPKSAAPKHFCRHVPKHSHHHEWKLCQLKINQVGDDKFRAASVSNQYHDKIDACLAHYLWGPKSTFAQQKGIKYVMELQVELLTYQTYQLRGQLAALGCPIVGDALYGGGQCDAHGHDHHEWNRMAAQCCALKFHLPKEVVVDDDDKKHLVSTEHTAEFALQTAWWSRYLAQYESYHQSY